MTLTCVSKHVFFVELVFQKRSHVLRPWLTQHRKNCINSHGNPIVTNFTQFHCSKEMFHLESQRYMTLTCIWKHSLFVELIFQKRSHVLRPWLTQHRKNCINSHGNPIVTNFTQFHCSKEMFHLESQRYMTLTCIWKHSLLVELIFQKRSHVLRPWLTQHRKNCINNHGNPWVTNFIVQKQCFT